MAYNKFRWWTKGRPNKPLKANAPLLLKIRNGDFDYSYMFAEAKQMRETSDKVYNEAYKNYGGTDEQNRIQSALEASQMKRVRALKLEFEANKDEQTLLYKLRSELSNEFGKDLWENAMLRSRGKGSLEDLYNWYKKQTKTGTTKSEIDIQLKRPNIKGLEYLL